MLRPASMLAACACALAAVLPASGVERPSIGVDQVLARVAEAVERYYARAQSLICLEAVRLQSLGADLLSDASPARRLDYELRVAWDPATDGDAPEANVLRQLVKIDGRPPRPKDEPGCMDRGPSPPSRSRCSCQKVSATTCLASPAPRRSTTAKRGCSIIAVARWGR